MIDAIIDNLDLILLAVLPIAMFAWMTWIYGRGLAPYHPKNELVWRGAAIHALALVLPLTTALSTLLSIDMAPENYRHTLLMIGGALTALAVLLPMVLTRDFQFHMPVIGSWLLAYQLASMRRSITELNRELPVLEQVEWDLYGTAD